MFGKSNPNNNHVVYISGPHGSGKSTLVSRLKEISPELQVQEQLAHLESLQEMTERAIWRTALHAIEHRMNLTKAERCPDQTIIGDRCYFDDLVYWRAFLRLGWITQRQLHNYTRLQDETYRLMDTPKPTRIVLLCPPYEWNLARVKQRWYEGEHVKWNEDNFTYLWHINAEFHKAAAQAGNGMLVVKETYPDRRVAQILQWVNGHTQSGHSLVEAGRRTYRNLGGSD